MADAQIRIFSYLPNPRVWKSLIAAEYCGVDVEVVGDRPPKLANWLWDFDARELDDAERTDDSPHARISRRGFSGTLYKTDAFLKAHPFGTVPAGFSADGSVGFFESNSILRAVARAGEGDHDLYGANGTEASRIDSFLDATLVLAREAQVYLLAISDMTQPTWDRMAAAYEFYMAGVDAALGNSDYLAGDRLTIADIGYVCDAGQFLRERTSAEALAAKGFEPIGRDFAAEYPRAYRHMMALGGRPEFAKHLGRLLQGL